MRSQIKNQSFVPPAKRYETRHVSRGYSTEPIPKRHRRSLVFVVAIVLVLLLVCLFPAYRILFSRTAPAKPEITSGIAGYCLDDHHGKTNQNAEVDAWKCNGTESQSWIFSGSSIKHASQYCLGVANNGMASGDNVVMDHCSSSVGQIWTLDGGGYQNPNSGLCLDVPAGDTELALDVRSCNGLSTFSEAWTATTWSNATLSSLTNVSCKSGTEGDRVACYAQQQWAVWRLGSPSHMTLLNRYSDGNGYEEWCADFVSYVYQQAGYPLSDAGRDGWDEYNANNLQNLGFTMHMVGSYIPKPGDIAYFNYPGGHVEIVVKGGKTPIFVYGDSGTIDPSTNNGEMNENNLTSDGTAGQLVYYLSPN